ncbi:MAG TPA: Ig-like domain-containing protein, partial [Pyrinomonadaceae bacterium]|nr:Ig-like domain-containing protein [Pyrinomonadaceae bacterium]
MKRFPRTSSPSNLSVFASCLLSFLMLLAPVASLAGSVKAAEAANASAEAQRKLTAAQKTEAFLFNAPLPAATPDVSATMTDSFTDGDADSKAEFGDTITYTADIINDGPVDATGVSFDATLDPNTELVSGSVKVSPLAFNDSYVTVKDTPLAGGASLLTNDTGQPGTPTLVVSAVVGCADATAPFENCATAQGGEVDVNADGTFTYTPASGFEGADSFNYTISNGVTPPNPGVDDTATATINVDAAPTVTATTPTDNAQGVNPTSDITVTFSEPVDVTGAWFTISCTTSGTHTATVTGGPTTFTLNPDTNLVGDETCTVTIVAAQVTDQDSNDPPDQMAADYVFDFQTDAEPEVTTTSPANGDNGVPTNANVVVNFSENVTATTSSFKIECPAGPANAKTFAVTGSGTNAVTLNPTADLPAGVTCTVTVVANQISDADAFDPPDNMAADYVFSFTTDAAPEVTTTTPTNGATNLPTNTTVQVNFSENVNATTSSFKIECPAVGNLQPFTLSASPSNSFTLTPSANLPGGTTCTVTVIAAQVTDQDGNDPPDNMAAD